MLNAEVRSLTDLSQLALLFSAIRESVLIILYTVQSLPEFHQHKYTHLRYDFLLNLPGLFLKQGKASGPYRRWWENHNNSFLTLILPAQWDDQGQYRKNAYAGFLAVHWIAHF